MNFGYETKKLFNLDERILFLNHGSFGSCPKSVLEAIHKINYELESEPVEFFLSHYFQDIRKLADRLGTFVGAKGEDLVFVENATTGVNTVLNSLRTELKPDDEIITTDHAYPAVLNALKFFTKVTNTKLKIVPIPIPVSSEEELISKIIEAVNSKTKLVILDHITSSSAIIFPVKEISRQLKEKGILVLIDGAHSPGMLDLNIEDIGCDWFTGNCHKWLYAPKGCALLWTSKEHQKITHPLSISLFYEMGYNMEFDWTGTKNPASYLGLNAALDFYDNMNRNLIRKYMYNLNKEAGEIISKELDLELVCPNNMTGAMTSFILSDAIGISHNETNDLRKKIFDNYKIEMPFFILDNKLLIRVSCQIYNEIDEYRRFCEILKEYL